MPNATKVLLVDDEPNILLPLRYLLETAGYEVFAATEGQEALQLADQYQPDLAVLDVMMPGMNGFELARQLRAKAAFAKLRIVFLTARGATQDRSEGYRSGAELYLTKPFDNATLLHTIDELLTFG